MIGTVPPSALQAAGDVRRAIGAEEDDHGGYLLGRRQTSQRAAGADPGEYFVAVASQLVREPALAEPRLRRRGTGRDGVAAHAGRRVEVGDEA